MVFPALRMRFKRVMGAGDTTLASQNYGFACHSPLKASKSLPYANLPKIEKSLFV
jgi:hypothetical protein